MHQVKINDKFSFETGNTGGVLTVDGQPANADVRQLTPMSYHVIHNLISYNIEVVTMDAAAKTAEIKVNGNTYLVTAKDQFDLLLDKLGMSDQGSSKISEIKAPMPGLVLKVFVAEGDVVAKGDNLFILEAMRWKTLLKPRPT